MDFQHKPVVFKVWGVPPQGGLSEYSRGGTGGNYNK